VALAVLVGVVVLADAYYQSHRIYKQLEVVLPSLRQASDHLAKGQLPPGDPFRKADQAVQRASRAVDHARITFKIAGVMPFFGRPVHAIRHGVAAAGDVTSAALITQRAVTRLLGDAARKPGSVRAADTPVYRGGKLDVKLLEGLTQWLQEALTRLRAAGRQIQAIPSIPFIPRVAEVREQAATDASRAIHLAERMLSGVRLVPSFLGAQEKKTYLVALGNEADLRGPGGAPLAYAIVTADRGRFELVAGGGINDIRVDPRSLSPHAPRREIDVPLPSDVAWYIDHINEAYPWIGTANFTPNYPLVAEVWARMVSKVTGRSIDGVIQMDQTAVAQMLGPRRIRLASYPRPITGQNLVDVVSHDQYLLPLADQIAFPTELIKAAWPRLIDPGPLQTALSGIGQSLAQKRIQLWSSDPDLQRQLARLGWDGALRTGRGDYLSVVDNKLVANKVDYYSRLAIDYDVTIDRSGNAKAVLQVTLTNDSPPALPRIIANPVGKGGYAVNRALMLALVPRQAELVESVRASGFPDHIEAGARVFARILEARPGKATTMRLEYSTAGVVDSSGAGNIYRLAIQHQPRITPADLRIRVTLPAGTAIREVPRGWIVKGNVLTLETQLTRDVAQEIVF
jgi:uncharacterized protein DUF4012